MTTDSNATSDRREHEARPESEPVVTARRRLVQGIFAAPAVLTLHSGTAFAYQSHSNCMIEQMDDPVQPQPLSSPSDTYIRVQLWSAKPNRRSSISSAESWYLNGVDFDAIVGAYPDVTNAFLRTGEWLEFDPLKNLVGEKVYGDPLLESGTPAYMNRDGAWVAVRFDASFMDVRIIGVVKQGEGGSAVSESCWNSFEVATRYTR